MKKNHWEIYMAEEFDLRSEKLLLFEINFKWF